jgi:hypothetical protein
MRFGPKGPRGSVWLGHFASLHFHATLHPQFVGPGNAAHFLIRAAKPSHTAGTLYDIKSEIYGGGGIRAAVSVIVLKERSA